ncbi:MULTISPECIES: type IV secretion system protein TraC [Enterobacteriaceae]|uniref:TraG P-loop domain-containing protein n=7 Tax=Enterobacterales TaxID=91347 RepID=A0A7G3NPT8_ECOLX|nr:MULTISPECIES: type IV secretion system protein TraC [Enterobacteriaceae]ELA0225229.1 type IV secretion system protein TraC [Klebsiella aerogenes]HCM4056271.1 type IV secretion system protein TraC [Klebsiella quasipneumoniae]HCM5246140.1 type IV secretion system protein TraC [Klebsiella variicola subsp. variicola]HCM6937040.1 type IV secretion system protein TraC [Klebsiella quasipneumoniae subsp. similipneumoniae]HEP0957355.1 type IV secretion system protein TraC [Klebsiella pneumoniae subs
MKFDLSNFKFDPLNVIETVNSIMGERDTTKETQQKLDDLDYPHIKDLLPFEDYDSASQLFINKGSIGFIIESQPLIGGNEALVKSLDSLLQDKVPRGTPLQVIMVSTRAITEQIKSGLKDFSWKGYRADECNDITMRYYTHAAKEGFPNGLGEPLTLRDYRLFFTWSQKVKRVNESEILKVRDVRRNLLAALNTADIHSHVVGVEEFLSVMREILNHDTERMDSWHVPYDPESSLATQMVDRTTAWEVKTGHIRVKGVNHKQQPFSSRMVSMNLDKNPAIHYLWQNGNIVTDLLNPSKGIHCPFVFTMLLITEEQMKSQGEANNKFLALDSRVNTSYAKYIPATRRQHAEWQEARDALLSNEEAITSYFYGITFFCADDDDVMAQETERTKNAFEQQGLKVVRADFMQIRNILAAIPFTATNDKLWKDFKRTGAVQRGYSFNAANLMPIIADNKLSPSGILLPSYRNQIAFLDVYDKNLPNTNFNWFMGATSGAGKSVLSQSICRSVLDMGGRVSITDIGDSYKKYCKSAGGIYINGENLRFNPFANVTDISQAAERIRDQLCILASPNGLLDDVHESLILEAITESWPHYEQDMRIDHVVDYMKVKQTEISKMHSAQIGGRIDEIVTLLNKYTTRGLYGEFFNSSEPTLSMDEQFVVTELGDLRKRGDLLSAVLFTLMIWNENMMYSTSRKLRKMSVIDEGWKLLGGSSKKIRDFIEEGYRTARRHNGSYGTITQSIRDKNLSTASLAAYDNSSFKFTGMQDAKSLSTLKQEEPNLYNELEWTLIEKLPPAKKAKFSAFLVSVGAYSSFHRLMLDPLSDKLFSSKGEDFAYSEKRLQENADIKDIIFEMVENDSENNFEKRDFLNYLREMSI